MIALLIRGEVAEKEVKAVAWVKDRYEPVLKRVIARPWPWIGAGAGTFGAAVLVFLMLGSEFLPVLGEGNLAMQALRIPSTSLAKSTEMQRQVETTIAKLPEVAFVYSKTGTAELASDPMPPNVSDTFIILKDPAAWRSEAELDRLIAAKTAEMENMAAHPEGGKKIDEVGKFVLAGNQHLLALSMHGY